MNTQHPTRAPLRDALLPFSIPSIGDEEIEEVVATLRSGWLTTGPRTRRFEAAFGEYVGSRHAMAVNSGTGAMHIALTALGIGSGDEVIVPTFTFCSTAHVVAQTGATPVLVEVGDDFGIDPEAVACAITPLTKAIMPVHYGGQSCDLAQLYEIAARHDLAVIEDAAHSVGADYHGLRLGSDRLAPEGVRRVTAFSFYANKNMTTGEGGMISTADDDLAGRMRLLTLHGMSHDGWDRKEGRSGWYYEVLAAGFKYNMSDIQAAIGIHQLAKLDGFTAARRRIASLYDEGLAGTSGILLPIRHPDRTHAYHLYVIRLDLEMLTVDRARFVDELRAMNIGSSVHFIPVHLHPYYREEFGYHPGDFPVAERLYSQVISLPMFPQMTENDVADVLAAISRILEKYRK
ncbi:MAG: DegT/DnrJ/EryC1/StrS family aminotransferase [Candidatus Eisenbacteria bacterium]|nr:DegT/DnrJ/EryC1/StrS family aminotransferase [Candidatus Eisenbacteria bacterium]